MSAIDARFGAGNTKPKSDAKLLVAVTEYIVLWKKQDAEYEWAVITPAGAVAAPNASAAIKQVASKAANPDGGIYVAVSARSWNPVKVTPKVETTLVLEDVKS